MGYNRKSTRVGEFLRRAREKSGLTQSEVSEQLNYKSPQFISNWERAKAPVPLEALSKLVNLYGIDAEELSLILLKEEKRFLKKYF